MNNHDDHRQHDLSVSVDACMKLVLCQHLQSLKLVQVDGAPACAILYTRLRSRLPSGSHLFSPQLLQQVGLKAVPLRQGEHKVCYSSMP
jgi:hypothetical protein